MTLLSKFLWFVPAILAFLAVCLKPIGNPDVFWHISVGRGILATGEIPRSETFSFTRTGAEWVDFEWLTQVLYAVLEGWGGLWCLIGLKTAVLSGAALAMERVLSRRSVPIPARAAAIWMLAAGFSIVNDVRPDNFSLLFFAIELLLLETLKPSGSSSAALLLSAGAFFSLWTNLHGGFIHGLALLGCRVLCAPLEKQSRPALKFYGTLLAAGVLGTLVNPYGWKLYTVIQYHARYSAWLRQTLIEWFPAGLENVGHWPFWILFALTAAVLVLPRFRREMAAANVLALCGLAATSAWHSRQTPFFVLAALCVVPGAWQRGVDDIPSRARGRLVNGGAAAAAGLSAIFFYLFAPAGIPAAAIKPIFPEQAVEFLGRHEAVLSKLRMYNPWGWGGYIGYRLIPRFKIFMDGRGVFLDLLREEDTATARPDDWREFVNRHELDLLLLKRDLPDMTTTRVLPGGRVEKEPRPYYLFFIPQDRWALVYWDSLAMVFARKEAVPRSWLEGQEYGVFHPGDIKALLRALAAGRLPRKVLFKEICRHVQESGLDPEAEELLGVMGPSSCL